MNATPAEVLAILTTPAACSRWAPIDFQIEELEGDRLAAGVRARVSGSLSGYRAHFDVAVARADEERLALRARGPIELDVEYRFIAVDGCTEVQACVGVRRRAGLVSAVIAGATIALLHGGALQDALARVADELEHEARERARLEDGAPLLALRADAGL